MGGVWPTRSPTARISERLKAWKGIAGSGVERERYSRDHLGMRECETEYWCQGIVLTLRGLEVEHALRGLAQD